MRKLLIILGVPIDDLTMDQALDRIGEFVAEGRATGKPHHVATVNADFVVKARHDPELRFLLQEIDMATADGMPLVWGARLLGVPLKDRVTGADLVPALCERAARCGYSVYFLGAAPGIAAQAVEVLCRRYPGLKVAGVQSPPNSTVLEMDRTVVDAVRAARPDILFVAFGNPKQEKWIAMHARELGVPVSIGVGASLDFVAGQVRRAPAWMQRAGLEWAFRLAQEPGRLWKRYVVDLVGFGVFFVRQWWAMRRGFTPSVVVPKADMALIDGAAVLRIDGRLDAGGVAVFMGQAEHALRLTSRLVADLSQATFLDSTALGALVAVTKKARDAGGDLVLSAPSQPVRRLLALVRLDRFFEIVDQPGQASDSRSARAGPVVRPGAEWDVIQAPRRFDAVTAPEVQTLGEDRLSGNARLVLDFSATVFLASAGLAAMVHLAKLARARGGEIRVANCTPDVERVIRMVKLDLLLPIHATLDAAMQ